MFRKILLCLALAVAAAGTAEARPFTAKDMAMLDRLSDPHVSPDGRFVAYNVRSTDWDENKGYNALWVLDLSQPGAAPRLIRDHQKGATEPRWSDDGRWLYFLSDRSGTEQLWRTPADSAAAVRVTDLPVDVMFYHVARDGHRLVIAANVYPDCDTLACSKAKDDAKAKVKSTGTVYDSATPRFWDSYLDSRYINLFAVTLKPEGTASDAVALTRGYQADVVSRPEGDDSSFAIAPDGGHVIFSARPSGSAQGLGDPSSLYSAAVDGKGSVKRIDPKSATSDDAPTLSPDGETLAYLSSAVPVFTAPRAHVMLRDIKSGQVRDLAPGWDRSPTALQWSVDGTTLYAVAEDVGQVKLFAIDPASGAVTALTGDGHVAGVDVAKGVMVYARDALDSPDEIYALAPGGTPQRLTNVGSDILSETPMSHFEQFAFTGWNGETVHGYVVEPAEFDAGKKYPVAFLIHGGPHGSFGNAWSYRWNPQVWAGMGYAAVMIDFHGSSGYGETFGKSIVGHWGDRPLEDLQKGWATALAKYPYLDGDRACALGGSYGGYMVAWIAGNWAKPWKCLVDHDGVFDIRLMSYSTDIPGFQQEQNAAASWVDPDAVERFNPVDHAAAWSDPILVVHSGHDNRVPLDQGMGAYGVAQLRHVPSELLYFPDENHWVLKPQNSVMWYATVEDWMKKWLK
jgi:dipeptidyl aminopeptidase/acylaminoacyl peptidase